VLAERVGWAHFFLLTTVVTLPALLLLVWIERREAAHSGQRPTLPALTRS
jgi:predicted MFS family arabinose efflux permease